MTLFDSTRTIIDFDADTHRYKRRDTGEILTSVTQKIDTIKIPFNTYEESVKYAKKHGRTPEYWRNQWENIKNVSLKRGNDIHDELEESTTTLSTKGSGTANFSKRDIINCLNGNIVTRKDLKNTPLEKKYPEIYEDLIKEIENGWNIYSEILVYNLVYSIAGLIDLPLIKGNKLKIKDWKTNKDDLKFTSGYFKKNNGIKTDIWVEQDKRFLKPLNYIQDCKGNVYTLQLSLYAYLAETVGLTCVELTLWHIHPSYILPYNIQYMREAAIKLLQYKNNNNQELSID
jgi:hypothetical protein